MLNLYDFALVVGSVITAAVDFPTLGLLLRVFRVVRIFKLVRISTTLQQLGRTFVFSLPSFINIVFITLMVFFVYAIIGT